MKSVKETGLYSEVLKELNYTFADVFIFAGFVISEIKENVNFTLENHGKVIIEDIANYLNTGTNGMDIIYISNRVHPYTIIATDWLKFYRNRYSLKGYYVVLGAHKSSMINTVFENMFLNSKIKKFISLQDAVGNAKEELADMPLSVSSN
ncbi:hypothetical protein [Lacinutrix himadriensis]|uniref:hypothetical protein n=1 Tax=Lacinutrix himadriensis TaxID=641549 RepID=UPI0006E450A7|nr:hypothetical protein [Lacinutrix himadriensis]